jgi:GAF domain-containing protein
MLARIATEGVGTTSCVFALLADRGDPRILAGYGHTDRLPLAGGVIPREDAPAEAEVLRTGHRLVIAHLGSTSLLPRGAAEAYREQGEAALLALPLINGDRCAGVMQLADSRTPRAFAGAHVAFAAFMARQAARFLSGDESWGEAPSNPGPAAGPLAPPSTAYAPPLLTDPGEDADLETARRSDSDVVAGVVAPSPAADTRRHARGTDTLGELQRQNRDLTRVIAAGLESATRLNADEVLRALVGQLAELTHVPVVDVSTVENDTLRALVSNESGQFDLEWEDVVIPLVRYPCSRRAVEGGESVGVTSLDDPLLDEPARYSLEKWGYQALLSMPLISTGRTIGLVELSDYVPRDFARNLALGRGLCGVAARALENSALRDQAERRSRILNELVEQGALGSRPSDIEGLQRHVAQRLRVAADAASCDIFRMTADGLRCVASLDRSGYDERPVGDFFDLHSYPTVVAAMNSHQTSSSRVPTTPSSVRASSASHWSLTSA